MEYQDTSEEWIALHGSERGVMWRLESENPSGRDLSQAKCDFCAQSRVSESNEDLGELVSVMVKKGKHVVAVRVFVSHAVHTGNLTAFIRPMTSSVLSSQCTVIEVKSLASPTSHL